MAQNNRKNIKQNNKSESKQRNDFSPKIIIKDNEINKKHTKKINLILFFTSLMTVLMIISIISTTLLLKNDNKILTKKEDKQSNKRNEIKKDLSSENYVLLGDSITEYYSIDEFFDEDIPIVKSGFAGYRTKDILKNLDEYVYRYNPTKVFILIGTNDLNSDESDQYIAYENIIKIIKGIKKKRENTEIYLESIYPINQSDNEKVIKENTGKRDNEIIKELNAKLKNYCEKNDVTYIDVYDKLLDNEGNLAIEYTVDGLHISEKGYSKITNILLKYMEK